MNAGSILAGGIDLGTALPPAEAELKRHAKPPFTAAILESPRERAVYQRV